MKFKARKCDLEARLFASETGIQDSWALVGCTYKIIQTSQFPEHCHAPSCSVIMLDELFWSVERIPILSKALSEIVMNIILEAVSTLH